MTQKEIDLVFEMSLNIHEHPWFKEKTRTREEVMDFVRAVLAQNEIYTIPMGASWGVITDKEIFKKINSPLTSLIK
jgi:hypothetical protein